MKNIFILYMAAGNREQMVHYEDTIKKKVSLDRIQKYIDLNLQNRLRNIFSKKPITVWGSRDSQNNRAHFEKMQPGDDVLIVEGKTIKLLGKIAAKTINADLSQELWKNLKGESNEGWNLVYFIANPVEIDLPFKSIIDLFNYKPDWSLRGFTSVAQDKLEEFYERYDDLYSILLRIKQEGSAEEKPIKVKEKTIQYELLPEEPNTKDGAEKDKEISEHVKVQWQLIRLGLKTGSKVWVPRADQSKISTEFGYKEFEDEFSTGIDIPKFVENIDVVWKEEFRIDAAFEIENTTSIYSGLLRFSDLKIVTPNSNYPLFIVAPTSKRNRLVEQIKRPTFKRMEFGEKVRYLSYEKIDEIDKFFENSTEGLSVDLLFGKSESIA